jgi:hypothetical protein
LTSLSKEHRFHFKTIKIISDFKENLRQIYFKIFLLYLLTNLKMGCTLQLRFTLTGVLKAKQPEGCDAKLQGLRPPPGGEAASYHIMRFGATKVDRFFYAGGGTM